MSLGLDGVLVREDPPGAALPVLFDSPHSGTRYPPEFRFACPFGLLRQAEDTFVDELFAAAPASGATLLMALFPRSFIDANRADDDIDPLLLDAPWPGPADPSDKSALGMGLVRRLARQGVPIYDRRLAPAEIADRIERYHRPYHAQMADILDALHGRFGVVWHVNCHSMPSTGAAGPGTDPGARPDFVLGDRDGTTCEPGFTRLVARALESQGYRVALNHPYKGVELVRRYSNPARGRHSLQLEINRRLYLNEETLEKHSGFEQLRRALTRLIGIICAYADERLTARAAE